MTEDVKESGKQTSTGKVNLVWTVGGAPSWSDANQFCEKVVLHREEVVAGMKTTDYASRHPLLACFNYEAADDVDGDELLFSLLLYRAAIGRKVLGEATTVARRPSKARPARLTPQLPQVPWSPLKPGDTVALLSALGGADPACPCFAGHMQEDAISWSSTAGGMRQRRLLARFP